MSRFPILITAAAIALTAAGCSGVPYTPTYIGRVVLWQDADIGDQDRFPTRTIAAAPGAQELPFAIQAERVRTAWARSGDGRSPEEEHPARDSLAFAVIENGMVRYEGYWRGTTRDSRLTSFSVAKSILSAAIGAAIADGLIRGLDEPVTLRVPELLARNPRFARITVGHLLDMSSGLRWKPFPFIHGDDAKTYYYPDLRRLALQDTELVSEPGQRFEYNNYHPLLLGLVLERATGMSVSDWVARRLWQPAGMVANATWNLDSDGAGFEKLESGFNARALDYARFGQLMLEGGVARDGRRVLPSAWAAPAAPDPVVRPAGYYDNPAMRSLPGLAYERMWWIVSRTNGPADFAAMGNYGQFVYVSPRHRLVIVRNGSGYGGMVGTAWLARFKRFADEMGRTAQD